MLPSRRLFTCRAPCPHCQATDCKRSLWLWAALHGKVFAQKIAWQRPTYFGMSSIDSLLKVAASESNLSIRRWPRKLLSVPDRFQAEGSWFACILTSGVKSPLCGAKALQTGQSRAMAQPRPPHPLPVLLGEKYGGLVDVMCSMEAGLEVADQLFSQCSDFSSKVLLF